MTTRLDAPESMTTTRLLLRKPCLADAEAIFAAYAADPEVVRYVTWQAHGSVEDTRGFLAYCESEWAEDHSYPYVLCSKEAPENPFGMIHPRRRPKEVEFGYVLARAEWGKGYMSEALAAQLDWVLRQPGVTRATAYCDIENAASAHVMEEAGMTFEAEMKGYQVLPNRALAPRDCKLYVRTAG